MLYSLLLWAWPSVGVFAVLLSVTGAIVSVIELSGWKRIAWPVVFVLLGVGECMSIRQSDNQHAAEVRQTEKTEQYMQAKLDTIWEMMTTQFSKLVTSCQQTASATQIKSQAPPAAATQTTPAAPVPSVPAASASLSSWSIPDIRFRLQVLANNARYNSAHFGEVMGGIENGFVKESDYLGSGFTPERQAQAKKQIADDQQKWKEKNGQECLQMRVEAVPLVTELLAREKVLPSLPEPSCFQTGKVSDGKQWTEVQTYLESIGRQAQ